MIGQPKERSFLVMYLHKDIVFSFTIPCCEQGLSIKTYLDIVSVKEIPFRLFDCEDYTVKLHFYFCTVLSIFKETREQNIISRLINSIM